MRHRLRHRWPTNKSGNEGARGSSGALPFKLRPAPATPLGEKPTPDGGMEMDNLCGYFYAMKVIQLTMRSVLIVTCGFLPGCWQPECDPAMPELLRNLHATVGWWSEGCPPPEDFRRQSLKEADSPQLSGRLRSRFPLGSDETAMERYLLAEGFQISSPCGERAPRVRQAQFHQESCPYPMNAKIAWERAEDGKLAWIKTHVFYKYP
ncbi:hypothetical protein AMJ97_CH03552 [Rhizobium sp. N1314]|nr:hypothetical protein AMK02_CH03554 [Rhizobium sp. N731]ANL17337.1 hypothetical protein AMJ97_CH03552 [Rhizobium sp. N1314]